MNRTHLIRTLGHWRTWWDLGSLAFAICFLTVLFGSSVPRTVLGHPTAQIVRSAVRWGFPASILFFFVGFARLAWRQRTGIE